MVVYGLNVGVKSISYSNKNRFLLGVFWVLAIVYVVDTVLDSVFPNFSLVPLEPVMLLCFSVVHGVSHYGWRRTAILLVAIFGVSSLLENVSVVTGFPFGFYHYSPDLGVLLFSVPVLVSLAYVGFGYVAWVLGSQLIRGSRSGSGWSYFGVTLLASLVLVFWDFCFEPILSTVRGWWAWEGAGFYGVPLSNFLGWFLTAFVFFGLFAVYLRGTGFRLDEGKGFADKSALAAVVIYAGTSLGFAAQYFFGPKGVAVDGAGGVWQVSVIYGTALILSVVTMVPVGILTAYKILRSRQIRVQE